VQKYTPYCTSYAFVHQDTFNNGWDVPELQKAYCLAATGSNTSTTISQTTVFTHSMGNLIFAGALESKHCSLDNSSQWFSANAPWRGSDAVPWLGKSLTETLFCEPFVFQSFRLSQAIFATERGLKSLSYGSRISSITVTGRGYPMAI